jgi:hypothetical protein
MFVNVSILTFPLLGFYFLNIKNNLKNNSRPFLICFMLMMIIYFGKIALLKDIIKFVLTLPILQHMRGDSPILYMLTFSAAILSGFGYDSIKNNYSGKSKYILLILLIGFSLFYIYPNMSISYIYNLLKLRYLKYWLIFIIFIFSTFILSQRKSNYKVGIIIGLFLLQVFCFKTINEVAPTPNKNGLRESNVIKKILENDNSYFRIWGVDIRAQHLINLPLVKSLNGFSMFFKNEHRWQLSSVFNTNINDLRPHFFTWNMSEVPINSHNDLIYLSNLKYILTYRKKEKEALDNHESWKLIANLKSKKRDPKYGKYRRYCLYERISWKSSLNIYNKWLCIDDINRALHKLRNDEFNIYDNIILDMQPQFHKTSYESSKHILSSSVEVIGLADDAMEFNVTTNKDAVLFVPEYYDKDWKAFINSNETKICRANASFMAIPVPKGHHTIILYYSPYLYHIGFFVSIITLFISIGGGFVLKKYLY